MPGKAILIGRGWVLPIVAQPRFLDTQPARNRDVACAGPSRRFPVGDLRPGGA